MSQPEEKNSHKDETRKKLDKMAPVQKGTFKQHRKQLSNMMKSSRVVKKKTTK